MPENAQETNHTPSERWANGRINERPEGRADRWRARVVGK